MKAEKIEITFTYQDFGVEEGTLTDAKSQSISAYLAEVRERCSAMLSGTPVTVAIGTESSVHVETTEDDYFVIKEFVETIMNEVWNFGDWHAKSQDGGGGNNHGIKGE